MSAAHTSLCQCAGSGVARTASERHAPDIKRARLRIANPLQRLIDRDVPLRAQAGTEADDAGFVRGSGVS